jgi:hypothetical protein
MDVVSDLLVELVRCLAEQSVAHLGNPLRLRRAAAQRRLPQNAGAP